MNELSFLRTWLPYIYLYVAGGLIFGGGMVFITYSGAINLKRARHQWWYKVLFFGFFYYLALHGIAILAALYL